MGVFFSKPQRVAKILILSYVSAKFIHTQEIFVEPTRAQIVVILAADAVLDVIRKQPWAKNWQSNRVPGIIIDYLCRIMGGLEIRRGMIRAGYLTPVEVPGFQEPFYDVDYRELSKCHEYLLWNGDDGLIDEVHWWTLEFPPEMPELVVDWWVAGALCITNMHARYRHADIPEDRTAPVISALEQPRQIFLHIKLAEQLGLTNQIPVDGHIAVVGGRVVDFEQVEGERLERSNHLTTRHHRAEVDAQDELGYGEHEDNGDEDKPKLPTKKKQDLLLARILQEHHEMELFRGAPLHTSVSRDKVWKEVGDYITTTAVAKRREAKDAGLIDDNGDTAPKKTWHVTDEGIVFYKEVLGEADNSEHPAA